MSYRQSKEDLKHINASETDDYSEEGLEVLYDRNSDYDNPPRPRKKRWVGICVLLFAVMSAITIVVLAATGVFAVNSPEVASASGSGDTGGNTGGDTGGGQPSNNSTTTPGNNTSVGVTPSPTASPTPLPTAAPVTAAPSINALTQSLQTLAGDHLNDPTSPQYAAYQWITQQDTTEPANVVQRYSALTAFFSLTNSTTATPAYLSQPECTWPIVSCSVSQTMTQLSMPGQQLNGTIPAELVNLDGLQQLDLGDNNLGGALPTSIFSMASLQRLYLEKNRLTGTLTEDVAGWTNLEALSLGNNAIGGSIPTSLLSSRSTTLRYISLHQNQFSGPIPVNISLSSLYYLDLSFNRLSGSLPMFPEGSSSLLHLYLDHNNLNGTVPSWSSSLPNLEELYLNDNQLTGGMPVGFAANHPQLLTLHIQHNSLTQVLEPAICQLDVYLQGNMIDLGSDCSICQCTFFCNACYN